MTRDPRKLEAFQIADELVPELYRLRFPVDERFGLQAQLRRAGVSVVANIVEGSARPSERDYRHFIVIAMGSASETRYLLELSMRLGFADHRQADELARGFGRVIRALQGVLTYLASGRQRRGRDSEARGPKSEVRSP